MAVSRVYSRAQCGMTSPLVTIEVHVSNGLPAFNIVGLPEKAVKESRDRVRSALMSNGFELPARRITVNLAPADLPKQGGRFDLPIALGLLVAQNKIDKSVLHHCEFAGELGLSGELRSIKGALPFAIAAQQQQRSLFLPKTNQREVSCVDQSTVFVAGHLTDIVAHLNKVTPLTPIPCKVSSVSGLQSVNMNEVQGQTAAKYALEIAASGGHHVLMRGSPGCGKSMLAQRLSTLLPPLTSSETLECAMIQSLSADGFNSDHWSQRPYRAPHHSASVAAMVGGGSPPQPGEISLAHHGVLFMDELPEYARSVLESLREPLENRRILISRAAQQVIFPADFMWVCAMNPCPCGYLLDRDFDCRCTPDQIQRYQSKISGPLLDRIDIRIDIERVPLSQLMKSSSQRDGSAVRLMRVIAARERQYQRQGKLNKHLQGDELKQVCGLSDKALQFLLVTAERLHLSARGYFRVLRLARTIADHQQRDMVSQSHLAQALAWR